MSNPQPSLVKTEEEKILPFAKLESAIRELVREELKKGPQPVTQEPPLQPKPSDGFWLFISITNIAMFFWWIPEGLWNNNIIDTLLKLVPWLGSSLFVLGYTWCHKRILELSRHRYFKAVQLAFLSFFLLLGFTQLSIFPINPLVEPEEAVLEINGKPYDKNQRKNIRLPIKNYKVLIKNDKQVASNEGPDVRQFYISYGDFIKTFWDSDYRPYFSPLYDVILHTQEPLTEVVIEKQGHDFDSDFLNNPRASHIGAPVEVDGKRTLHFRWPSPDDTAHTLRLPYGNYKWMIKNESCPYVIEQSFFVGKDIKPVKITTLCAKSP